jgi:hypothetical protein
MNPILRASTASLLTVMVSSMSVITGCKSSNPNATPSPDASQSASQSAAPIVNPAATPSSPSFQNRRQRRSDGRSCVGCGWRLDVN